MIKTVFWEVEIHGSKPMIMAELDTTIRALSNYLSKDEIMQCVNNGLKTNEELSKDLQEVKRNFLKNLKNYLNRMG